VQLDSERWGVQITRVEIFNILPPSDIAHAMERQIKAERTRRAKVLRADGQREAAVIKSRGTAARMLNEAEGERAAVIARAHGEAEAKVLVARAQATAVSHVRAAMTGGAYTAVDYLTSLSYLTTLGRLSTGGKAILLPRDVVSTAGKLLGPDSLKPFAA